MDACSAIAAGARDNDHLSTCRTHCVMLILYLQLLADGLVRGSEVGLVAISFAYIYSTTGVFHIAHAGVYTAAGYVAWYLCTRAVPFPLALLAAVAVGVAIGLFLRSQLYDRLERKGASPLVVLIASIGALTALQNIVAIAFTPDVLQFKLSWRTGYASLGEVTLTYPQIALLLAGLCIVISLMAFNRYTPLGKRIRAVASNRDLAETTLLRPEIVGLHVMAIASGIVAVPAVLTGVDQALQPYTSLTVLLFAVIAMIAGGIGSVAGAYVMALVLTAVQSVSIAVIPAQWSVALVFAIFIAFILVRPEGLFRQKFSRLI